MSEQNSGHYLSIVVTSRNDNHGGDLLQRTSAFVNGVYAQSLRWNLPLELIIVDWNPPSDKPLLQNVLPKPTANCKVKLKYIIVPIELHQKYKNSSAIPLFQMIAKNVGIRRAEGDFILCTNIDILFSDECFKELAAKRLKKGTFYRANRCDVPREVMKESTLDAQLAYAKKNIIKRLGKSKGHETLTLPRFMYFFPNMARLLNLLVLNVWKRVHKDVFPHFIIDFDACGDFTLMSKEDWVDIEGYVELEMYSIHIDSMALWAASALGKKQELFPYNSCIYHIYHEDGWESDDALRTIQFLMNKPCLDYTIIFKAGSQIVKNKNHWKMNKPDWGMANLQLETAEYTA